MRRRRWWSLSGTWEFVIDLERAWGEPDEVRFDRSIRVPFAPETAASGVGDTSLYACVWYRRTVEVPRLEDDQLLLLHFGAVDYEAQVFVDGCFAGRHEGGYTPFTLDVTRLVRGKTEVTVVVAAHDDPLDLAKPRGKQDWKAEPHAIWYPRTTGIWQTVWMEVVPRSYILKLKWTPNLERWELGVEVVVANSADRGQRLKVVLRSPMGNVADDEYAVVAGEVHRRIALSDPGIDDSRNELFWSPSRPTLIEAEVTLFDGAHRAIDVVRSYTAIRSVSTRGDRFVLNGRPFHLKLVLDQGYWEGSGMTAPDDAAIRRDVELAKSMGFNGVRKHQKIEDPRYLYWADRLGLLVWEEMPSAYRFTVRSIHRLLREWLEVLDRDSSHPCIVAWVPFNESWGVPNLPDNAPERHYIHSLYHLTKTLDPTRPVIGNDGWESVATDIIGIHDYDSNAHRLAKRYFAHDVLPRLLMRERPGGRSLVLDGQPREQPIVLSELGGISLSPSGLGNWGYSEVATATDLEARYHLLMRRVVALELLSGFCYTQFADTFQETNGLLRADRTPKFDMASMAAALAVDEIKEGGVSVAPPGAP